MASSGAAAYHHWHGPDRFGYRGAESVVRAGRGFKDEADAGAAVARWKARAEKSPNFCNSDFRGGFRGIVRRGKCACGLAWIVHAGQLSFHIHSVEAALAAFHDYRRNTGGDAAADRIRCR